MTVRNIADVMAVIGADELDYTLSVSGDLFGGISGMNLALSEGNTHLITLDTSTVGIKSGMLTVLGAAAAVP